MDYVNVIEGLIGETIGSSDSDVVQADISQYMSEGLQTIVNVLPEDMMWMLEANTKEYTEATAEHGASIGTNKILYVQRLSDSLLVDSTGSGTNDSKMLVECREVSPALRGRVKAGSGWKEEASETDPVYYKLDKKIFIEPLPIDYRASGSEIGNVATITKTESGSTGFTVDGTYTGSGRKGYIVEVQDPQDSIDRFKWSDDDGSTYKVNTPTNKMPHADYQHTFFGAADGWASNHNDNTFTFVDDNSNTTGYGTLKWVSQSGLTLSKTGLSISGQDNQYVHMRVKASHNTAHPGGKFYGRLYFSTAALSSGAFLDTVGWKAFSITSTDTWQEIILDMHDLNSGGTNYENNIISGFRLYVYTGGFSQAETFDIDWFAAGSGATATSNGLSNGINITWTDGNTNHNVGDKYEFQVNESPRSKVYYISVPPSGWVYNSDYLDGTVPNEVDPIVLNYVVMRALEKKLAKIQNGSSASLEQYIIDEDLDLAQGQQILIQDTNALIDRFAREYQIGLQSLMAGTYKGKTTDDRKEKQAYQNVAQ